MFQQLDGERLAFHIQLLGWIHVIGELIGIGIGLFFFLMLNGIAAVADDPDAARVLPLVAFLFCGAFVVFALPGLIAGIGLLRRSAWARVLALVVGFFNLFWLPIGTLVGLYTFWVLLQDAAAAAFDRRGGLAQ